MRLGADVFSDGAISEEKIKHLVKTMKAFWYLMDVHGVEWFHAYATSAMREASNVKSVIKKVKKAANIDIEPISGDREAELIFGNFAEATMDERKDYLYIDVGRRQHGVDAHSRGATRQGQELPTGHGATAGRPHSRWRMGRRRSVRDGIEIVKIDHCTPLGQAATPTACSGWP